MYKCMGYNIGLSSKSACVKRTHFRSVRILPRKSQIEDEIMEMSGMIIITGDEKHMSGTKYGAAVPVFVLRYNGRPRELDLSTFIHVNLL
jgi:hypothetical protein